MNSLSFTCTGPTDHIQIFRKVVILELCFLLFAAEDSSGLVTNMTLGTVLKRHWLKLGTGLGAVLKRNKPKM